VLATSDRRIRRSSSCNPVYMPTLPAPSCIAAGSSVFRAGR
jgi:hypothetical protein